MIKKACMDWMMMMQNLEWAFRFCNKRRRTNGNGAELAKVEDDEKYRGE